MTKEADKKTTPQPEMSGKYYYATGRRKEAVAQVRLYPGKGQVIINGKKLGEYFSLFALAREVSEPFKLANLEGKFDVKVIVRGGGARGQAEAIRLGVARALEKHDKKLRLVLKKAGYLRRDPRVKERKKYGLKKARRAPQWQKR